MKKLGLILATALLSCFSAAIQANTLHDSGPFNLPGGMVGPKQKLVISLHNLVNDDRSMTYFDITCYMENTHFANAMYPVAFQVFSTPAPQSSTLNGHPMTIQDKLDQQNNVLEMRRIPVSRINNNFPNIEFINLDDLYKFSVRYCVATYSTV